MDAASSRQYLHVSTVDAKRRRRRSVRWMIGAGCLAMAGLLLGDVGAWSRQKLAASAIGTLSATPSMRMVD